MLDRLERGIVWLAVLVAEFLMGMFILWQHLQRLVPILLVDLGLYILPSGRCIGSIVGTVDIHMGRQIYSTIHVVPRIRTLSLKFFPGTWASIPCQLYQAVLGFPLGLACIYEPRRNNVLCILGNVQQRVSTVRWPRSPLRIRSG